MTRTELVSSAVKNTGRALPARHRFESEQGTNKELSIVSWAALLFNCVRPRRFESRHLRTTESPAKLMPCSTEADVLGWSGAGARFKPNTRASFQSRQTLGSEANLWLIPLCSFLLENSSGKKTRHEDPTMAFHPDVTESCTSVVFRRTSDSSSKGTKRNILRGAWPGLRTR